VKAVYSSEVLVHLITTWCENRIVLHIC
jgi:hypothetical protein